jgi:hypothetical protein
MKNTWAQAEAHDRYIVPDFIAIPFGDHARCAV